MGQDDDAECPTPPKPSNRPEETPEGKTAEAVFTSARVWWIQTDPQASSSTRRLSSQPPSSPPVHRPVEGIPHGLAVGIGSGFHNHSGPELPA